VEDPITTPRGPTGTRAVLVWFVALGVGWAVAGARGVTAQVAGDTVTAASVQESPVELVPPPAVSPGGAFLRSVLVPGWGQAANGAYNRAGFYLVAQSGTVWMISQIRHRLGYARGVQDLRREDAEASLRAQGVTNPDSLRFLVEEDEAVQDAQSLIDARQQQFEDWLALGIFMVLLSGVDAFVTAHLSGFPEPVELQADVLGSGAVELGISIPVGGGRRR
jgi:hypothetical protein